MNLQNILEKLLDEGIDINLSKTDGTTWYNLNTGMKSDLYIAEVDNQFVYKARYGVEGNFEDYHDLLYIAKSCLHGRDFADYNWLKLFKKESI